MTQRLFCIVLLYASLSGAVAAAAPRHAGFVRMTVNAAEQADAAIWYPTDAPEVSWQVGPFTIAATQGAPVAQGRFPVVLVSHGRQGGPLSHRELAAQLARDGFIVVVPTHVGDAAGKPLATNQSQVLMNRPGQAMAALDALFADKRFSSHADPARIGMIGFSAGGYTGLILAGAKPDFARASAYCQTNGRDDMGACRAGPGNSGDQAAALMAWQAPSEPRLKALVLLDPLAIMFDARALASVGIPTLLYRPQDDAYLRSGSNATALVKNLPRSPQEAVVPGRHFVFVDPCPEKIAAELSMICQDEPGVDRPAIHRTLEREIAAFLNANL